MNDPNILLEQAINEMKYLISGESFLVRDLFKGYFWKRIPLSNRLLLGTLFLNYVKNNRECLDVVPVEKTAAGQQLYVINHK